MNLTKNLKDMHGYSAEMLVSSTFSPKHLNCLSSLRDVVDGCNEEHHGFQCGSRGKCECGAWSQYSYSKCITEIHSIKVIFRRIGAGFSINMVPSSSAPNEILRHSGAKFSIIAMPGSSAPTLDTPQSWV